MQLTDAFDIAAPADALWTVLNDVERVAPLVPGFALEDVEGDTYRGTIKVKLGAITASYNAEIDVLERDAAARRVVFGLAGRERRGPGTVKADVSSRLVPGDGVTRLEVATEVQVTGRVAQLGMGALGDVSHKLLGQFVASIEQLLAGQSDAPSTAVHAAAPVAAQAPATAVHAAPPASGAASRPTAPPVADAVDLGAIAGDALRQRLAPVGWAALGLLVGYLAGALREARRR